MTLQIRVLGLYVNKCFHYLIKTPLIGFFFLIDNLRSLIRRSSFFPFLLTCHILYTKTLMSL
ncbi:hypothetical protein QWZ13_13240 [Reinekea marina]|uniref:hypothetical protein n=1 Tax=Reinekea marina TaxID=1310421 RepID=UPI0025B2D98C|nr:hypothetical protein [Reinekea marina]MDN3649878.1 hypothetical protein [Reinekea marina]